MSRSRRAAARWRLSRTAHSASETPDGAAAQLEEITDPTVGDEISPEDSGDTALAESSPPEAAAFAPHPVSRRWSRIVALGVLPAVSLMLTAGAGWLKWHDGALRDAQQARIESVRVAAESTVALLSYRPDTVARELGAARDRLTGAFRDSYTSLIHDVVIPGAQQKQISATATVAGTASVSANESRAVVLVFVDQSILIGRDPPSNTASAVRVTLDKDGDRWLISAFDPV
jgi:Mce-associated membrane protein